MYVFINTRGGRESIILFYQNTRMKRQFIISVYPKNECTSICMIHSARLFFEQILIPWGVQLFLSGHIWCKLLICLKLSFVIVKPLLPWCIKSSNMVHIIDITLYFHIIQRRVHRMQKYKINLLCVRISSHPSSRIFDLK